MMKRPGGADFAPGAYVFPGGTVTDDDRAFDDHLRAAAVRELFEEVGILLASGATDTECDRVRQLVSGGEPFGAALAGVGLVPDFDALVLFARWVTPAMLRRRYDARFYLARMPAGQEVRAMEGEVSDWVWISPSRALASREITLVYATRAVLESVAGATDVESLFRRARAQGDVPVVEPRVVQTAAGWEVLRD